MLENKIGEIELTKGEINLEFGPFEILTLMLALK